MKKKKKPLTCLALKNSNAFVKQDIVTKFSVTTSLQAPRGKRSLVL